MQVSFAEAFRVWLKIGLLGFGGPAGQIALMHRIIVDEKKWVDEARFLHALNFCMLLPGPEAQKLATYIGWLLHGTRGGLVAGILFVLPGALVMLAVSLLYVLGQGIPVVEGALFGIKAAVLVIVVEALIRIGRRALKTRLLYALAVLAFIGIFFLDLPFPLIVVIAAVIGYFTTRGNAAASAPAPGQWRRAALTAPMRRAATTPLTTAHTGPMSPDISTIGRTGTTSTPRAPQLWKLERLRCCVVHEAEDEGRITSALHSCFTCHFDSF